ncbi:hypothetical protein GCM10029976_066800 [Kribbella albertanoniae]|uniref:Uncharacterized protein n=1 Tax=Kribbella albertanoniae TaxID=1266829 RepID=A0A4R4QJC1_9ACTN|nr:hypothetical protein [Kribbella albertanoniae]TDC35794.1 hypothetical protein E1261_00250 [Kribbella albertanoniae]
MIADSKPVHYAFFVRSWIGHHAYRILLTAYAAQLTDTAADKLVALPSGLAYRLDLSWTTTVLYAGLALILHARGPLCERCIAEMSLDGSARAEQYRRNLTTVHRIRARPLGCLVITASAIALVILARHTGLISKQVKTLLFATPAMWIFLSLSRHSRLQPWCPQCRGDGGGRYHRAATGPKPRLALNS